MGGGRHYTDDKTVKIHRGWIHQEKSHVEFAEHTILITGLLFQGSGPFAVHAITEETLTLTYDAHYDYVIQQSIPAKASLKRDQSRKMRIKTQELTV